MTAFATASDLAGYLQVDSVDTFSANQALDIASQTIRTACGWSISEETVTAEEFDGSGTQSIWIRTLNLTAVATVVSDGTTLTSTDYRFYRYGRVRRINAYWPCFPKIVTVTYTHGYASVPDDVKGACLALAAGKYQNPEGVRSYTETVGGVTDSKSYSPSNPAAVVPVDDPDAVITRYKLHGFA